MAKKPTLEDAKNFMLDFYSKNPGVDKDTAWNSFLDTVDKTNRKFYEGNQVFQNSIKGYYERLKNENSGTANEKGSMSKADNLPSIKIEAAIDKAKKEPKTEESAFKIRGLELAAKNALKQMEGKTSDEQKKIVSEIFPEEKEQKEEKKDIAFKITPEKKDVTFSETAKEIEQAERDKEIDDKSSAFLKSWASTHPSWLKILSSSDLSWGQKVALVGSALANIGANVTLGAKAGFEHSSFNGVPWDFKQAIDKYTENELETVLKGEQNAKAKATSAEFWETYRKEKGKEATDELMALVDLYGDNPDVLSSRLRAMSLNMSADEVKNLYANLEKTNLSESAKQKMLDTQAKQIENRIKELQAKVTGETAEKLIEAQNALNNFNSIKYSSDGKTYNIEKAGSYLRNILHEVEGVASTVGGVMTGGVVGGVPSVKDGIIKARGIPQKIVRADGSEIQLDPNDNVYATKNELTTEKDDGSDIVHMTQSDEAVTVQKKLGYAGGAINKDFDYYLSKLRG